jgi:hypothetical protein
MLNIRVFVCFAAIDMRSCIVVMPCSFQNIQRVLIRMHRKSCTSNRCATRKQQRTKVISRVTVLMQSKHLLSLIATSQHVTCFPLTTCYYHYLPLLTLQWLFLLLLLAYFVCVIIAAHTAAPRYTAAATVAVLLCCCCTLYQHCWSHKQCYYC